MPDDILTQPTEQPTDNTDAVTPTEPVAEPVKKVNPNRAGTIRRIEGAHLVYKRLVADGTYTELWVFNTADSENLVNEITIKKAIMAATDIPFGKTESTDGGQIITIKRMGNVQFAEVTGLPN